MFVDLTNQPCLVVGGGTVAYRKVRTLLDFDAAVVVVAEEICDSIVELAAQADNHVELQTKSFEEADNRVELHKKSFEEAGNHVKLQTKSFEEAGNHVKLRKKSFEETDCDGMTIVVAATDDIFLNHRIAQYCKQNGIMVNAVDQKEDCSFIFPSYRKEKNLVAAFSSGGNSPVLTQYLKEKENPILTPFLGELNEYMGEIRETVIREYENESERKRAFQEIAKAAIESGKLPQKIM